MYLVKENGDGTVTIDRKVYDEMHRRACTERTEYIPLTQEIRAAVNDTINQRLAVLDTCESTPLVNLSRIANEATRHVINALPNGYMLPVTRQ